MPTKILRAYHNRLALKRATLKQVRNHRLADELVQGQYWRDGKGCAVACLTHSGDGAHDQYPIQWGIPLSLAHLEDRIFEGLKNGTAQAWPERFLGAIPVGADLSKVTPHFLVAVVQRRRDALNTESVQLVGPAMDQVLVVLRKWAETGRMTPALVRSAWSAARSAGSAWSAAWSARSAAWSARSAAWSARSAAWSAARSAARSAESAWSAAESARSAASAESAEYEWMADTLVALLKAAK